MRSYLSECDSYFWEAQVSFRLGNFGQPYPSMAYDVSLFPARAYLVQLAASPAQASLVLLAAFPAQASLVQLAASSPAQASLVLLAASPVQVLLVHLAASPAQASSPNTNFSKIRDWYFSSIFHLNLVITGWIFRF